MDMNPPEMTQEQEYRHDRITQNKKDSRQEELKADSKWFSTTIYEDVDLVYEIVTKVVEAYHVRNIAPSDIGWIIQDFLDDVRENKTLERVKYEADNNLIYITAFDYD